MSSLRSPRQNHLTRCDKKINRLHCYKVKHVEDCREMYIPPLELTFFKDKNENKNMSYHVFLFDIQ